MGKTWEMRKCRAWILLCAAVGFCNCRFVTVSRGPLLRIAGQPLSIRCDVSAYEGPREQEFEWMVTQGKDTINVISTFDPGFSDPSLKNRISSGDITMFRLADNAVELKIKEARLSDSATYRCNTPSTDFVINGNYYADVQLQIVPDSLTVASEAPSDVVPEGGSFRLLCNVSRNFSEGIYTSLTWAIKKGSLLLEELLTFGPDLSVTVGDDFMERYTDGGIRLEIGNGVSHSLVLSEALPADQGTYVCTAKLWTREEATWNRIQEKAVVMGEVSVTPTANYLGVKIQDNATLSAGDTLHLLCSVSVNGMTSVDLEVAWLLNSTRVLAHLGRDGVLNNTSDMVDVRRLGKWLFQIRIHNVETSDMGLYSCKVSTWVQLSTGRWHKAAEKTATPVQVYVTAQNPDYSAVLSSALTAEFSGDTTVLECKVTNMSNFRNGRFGVVWLHRDVLPGDVPVATRTVALLDENGTLVPGKSYKNRIEKGLITMAQITPYMFKLRFFYTTDTDAGEYTCRVMAWIQSCDGNLKKVSEYLTPALKVSFASKYPILGIVARRLREATFTGTTFEMSCQVNAQNLPTETVFSIAILYEEAVGTPTRKLASLDPEMVLKIEDLRDLGQKDSLELLKTGKKEFQFRIQGVQVTNRGFYFCEMKGWIRQPGEDWIEMAKGVSNKVQIAFTHQGPSFGVSIASDTAGVFPGETAKMECDVSVSGTSPTSDDVAFEMKWFLTRLRGLNKPSLLATMDRWGIMHKTPRNDSSDCSVERLGLRRYALSVHGTQDSDVGNYHCTLTPWVRSTSSGLWSKAPEMTSQQVFLNVKFPLWDSMRLPMLYGVGASLTVAVVSLSLGLFCSHCCCRKSATTPRSRTKLMELEID